MQSCDSAPSCQDTTLQQQPQTNPKVWKSSSIQASTSGEFFLIKNIVANNFNEPRTEIHFLRYLPEHPNLVKLVQADFAFERAQLIFTSGSQTLLQYINTNGPLSEATARRIFCSLLNVVGHLHKRGVIHTNLKAETVLLTPDLTPLICDLEYARFWNSTRQMVQSYGSLHYASPEMFREIEINGPEVDTWALGVILYAMVAGHLPWNGPSRLVANLICRGSLLIPAHFSPELTVYIQNIFSRRLPERLKSIDDLKRSTWLIGKSD